MQNEDYLTKLDTLQDIIHKMSILPEDYDTLQRAEAYANEADELIGSIREPFVEKQGIIVKENPEEIFGQKNCKDYKERQINT